MKIIGAGFGRTGTLSLKIALEQLGFAPCYHMQEVIPRPHHIYAWHKIGRGGTVDWQRLLNGFPAGVDFPVSIYYKELLEVFPEAKVILTVRDPERWYESTAATIYPISMEMPRIMQWLVPPLGMFIAMTNSIIWDGLFHGRFADKEHAIAVFNEHTVEVKRVVPPEKLLIFHPRDGWEPLCRFLEVPVPEGQPFPHVNDRAQMEQRLRVAKATAVGLPVALLAGAVGGGVALWRWLKRQDAG